MLVVFAFRVLCATVFAEPAVPEIEEVVGLVHKERGAGFQVSGAG